MKGRIYAVVWTPGQYKIVPTKKAGNDEMRAWKAAFEAAEWEVHRLGTGYVASCRYSSTKHAIVFHEYDAETKQRIYPPFKPPKPRLAKSVEPKPRRGRKPVGV